MIATNAEQGRLSQDEGEMIKQALAESGETWN